MISKHLFSTINLYDFRSLASSFFFSLSSVIDVLSSIFRFGHLHPMSSVFIQYVPAHTSLQRDLRWVAIVVVWVAIVVVLVIAFTWPAL